MKSKKLLTVIAVVLCAAAIAVLTSGVISYIGRPSDDKNAVYADTSADKDAEKQITYNGAEVELKYNKTINRQATVNGKVTSKYNAVDEYNDASGNAYYFYYNTSELCGFFSADFSNGDGSELKEAELVAKVRGAVSGFVYVSSYELQSVSENQGDYTITLSKKLSGVFTDDFVTVSARSDGTLLSWMLFNTGRYDDCKLTEEQISACRESLVKKIDKECDGSWSAADEYITVNDGKLQLCISAEIYRDAGSGERTSYGQKYYKTIK